MTDLTVAAPHMEWRRTYTVGEVGAKFLENYGWTEIVGLHGALPSVQIACGFLILGPTTDYPRHHHVAEEIYIPLSGTALWQQGEGPWLERTPGSVIHHRSDELHAMRTRAQPLLALYLWRGMIEQRAHFG